MSSILGGDPCRDAGPIREADATRGRGAGIGDAHWCGSAGGVGCWDGWWEASILGGELAGREESREMLLLRITGEVAAVNIMALDRDGISDERHS